HRRKERRGRGRGESGDELASRASCTHVRASSLIEKPTFLRKGMLTVHDDGGWEPPGFSSKVNGGGDDTGATHGHRGGALWSPSSPLRRSLSVPRCLPAIFFLFSPSKQNPVVPSGSRYT